MKYKYELVRYCQRGTLQDHCNQLISGRQTVWPRKADAIKAAKERNADANINVNDAEEIFAVRNNATEEVIKQH